MTTDEMKFTLKYTYYKRTDINVMPDRDILLMYTKVFLFAINGGPCAPILFCLAAARLNSGSEQKKTEF